MLILLHSRLKKANSLADFMYSFSASSVSFSGGVFLPQSTAMQAKTVLFFSNLLNQGFDRLRRVI